MIVNNRRGGCPHCAPYVGRVFIDDVYSGGNKSDGKYPLLSEAIEGGLFHPRCKDSTSTYFKGITEAKPVTKEKLAEMDRREKLEQKQSYCKNEAKKNRRIAEHSLDADNKRTYSHRAEVFEQKADEISINLRTIDAMSKSFRPQYEPYSDFVLQTANREIKIPVKRVRNSEFELFTDVEATRRNKAVRLIEKQLQELKKQFPPDYTFPKVAIVDFQKHGFGSTAIAGYDNKMGIVYFNSLYHSPKSIVSFLTKNSGEFASTSQFAPLLHEFGHKYYYDCIQTLAKSNKLTYNKAKATIDGKISEYIHDNITGSGLNLSMVLSSYADYSYQKGKLTEVIAEAFSSEDNFYGNKLIKVLKEEVSNASSAR